MVQRASSMITHVMKVVIQEKTRLYMECALKDDFIPLLPIETYDYFHFHFDSFLISCTHVTIACHHQSFLILVMLISYYCQCVSIALQHSHAVVIRQCVVTLGKHSSFLPNITINVFSSLANLWQMMF